MKKTPLLLSASLCMLFVSCSPSAEEKTAQDTQVKADSVNEQKNLDSLFNAAGQNMDAEKDSAQNK